MEAHLLTIFASVVFSVGFVFWIMRLMITDLRSQNADQQKQITANLFAVSTHLGRITVLEHQAKQCDEDHKEFREKMAAIAETCPITLAPCPLRVMFKSGSKS